MTSFASIILASSCRGDSRFSVESDFTFTLVAQWEQGKDRCGQLFCGLAFRDPTREVSCLERSDRTSLLPFSSWTGLQFLSCSL